MHPELFQTFSQTFPLNANAMFLTDMHMLKREQLSPVYIDDAFYSS
jgi:hypothetical protein